MATGWRPANSLTKLRDQINESFPNRNKASDGMLGDAAHAKTVSDHNPNQHGVVTAIDITHDPKSGCNVQAIADNLIAARDPRIKYLIFNDHIMVPNDYGWRWVYHFAGSHRSHLHVSVYGNYDDTTNWSIGEIMPTITREQVIWHYRLIAGVEPSEQEIINYTGKDYVFATEDIKRWFANKGLGYNVYRQNVEKQLSTLNTTIADLNKRPTTNVTNLPTGETEVTASIPNPDDPKQPNVLVRILFNIFGKK